jgi:hypothetical protein
MTEPFRITNRNNVVSADRPRWEKTPDGFLRCRARILAERIMPYGKHELGEGETINAIEGDHVQLFVPRGDMAAAESLRSLEGCPCVIGEHQWLDASNAKQFSVGHVAGTPVVDGPYLVCDLLITDPAAIDQIESDECPEISAAYRADTIFEPGEHEGQSYHGKQTKFRYNHIAIIPAGHGRAGQDVRIINNKGEAIMAEEKKLVRVRLRNTGRYVNVDEESAKDLENELDAAEEAQQTSGKQLEELMTEAEAAKAAAEAANAELEETKGELSVYKEKLDEILDDGVIEEAANAMIEEQGEAEEILENAIDEEDEKKEEIMNSIKGLRGARLHSQVLNSIGVKCENMSPEALRGAFKAQHQIANAFKGRGKTKRVSGAKLFNTNDAQKQAALPNGRTGHQRLGFGAK